MPHPEYLAHAPGQRTAVLMQDDGGFEFIDLLLVVGLEVQGEAATGRKG